MSQARVATGMDRLPWLADEPAPPPRRQSGRGLAAGAVTAILLLAGASYWMGAHSLREQTAQRPVRSTTTVLPAPRQAQPQPQVVPEPPPQVKPSVQREVPISMPRIERKAAPAPAQPAPREIKSVEDVPEPAASAAVKSPAPAAAKPLTPWPAWQSQGANGRIVQIGAFGSRQQAKLGWRYMVRAYPAVAHLQAMVVETRNSRGRAFYRFQIGTTSQAHSEVLCQRMEKISLSCAVVGLPWKPKGVER